jgi:O-antigen/teichoic acid export membrane protein
VTGTRKYAVLLASQLRSKGQSLSAILIGQVASMVGLAVGTRLLTQVASASTYGEWKMIVGVVGLCSGFVLRPFAQFAMREYHDAVARKSEQHFQVFARSVQLRIAVVCALCTIGILLGFRTIFQSPGLVATIAVGGYLVAEAMWTLERGLRITQNHQASASVMEGVLAWTMPVAAAGGVVIFGDSADVFIACQSTLLVLLLVLWFSMTASDDTAAIWSDVGAVERACWTENARRFVMPMVGLSVLTWIVNIGDRYVIAYFHGPAAAGQYSAVYALCSTPLTVMGGMSARALYPFWFRSVAEQQAASTRRMFIGMLLFTSCAAAAVVMGILVFGASISEIVLAESYRTGAPDLMRWIAGGYAVLIVASVFEMSSYAYKRTARITISYGLAATVNVLLNLLWVPKWGALGAARATFSTFAVYGVVMSVLMRGPQRSGEALEA